MSKSSIPERIDSAVLLHEFEFIAHDIWASRDWGEYAPLFRSRLSDLNLDLPERLYRYARKIMDWGEPSYEEIHKIFSLARSIETLAGLEVPGANECLIDIAGDIHSRLATDPRYGMVRGDIFGTEFPAWWVR
ncbi:MAG: hypothetical protein ACK4UQ_08345 [Brevundimonas sp.]